VQVFGELTEQLHYILTLRFVNTALDFYAGLE
jgi:hypothetical protein